jgi:hypothetical protein
MDINQWMIKYKFAKNEFNAMHIFNGLDLAHEPRFWKRVHRVILYRDWRNSKIFKTSAECYAKAIAGERVAKLDLTPAAM